MLNLKNKLLSILDKIRNKSFQHYAYCNNPYSREIGKNRCACKRQYDAENFKNSLIGKTFLEAKKEAIISGYTLYTPDAIRESFYDPKCITVYLNSDGKVVDFSIG